MKNVTNRINLVVHPATHKKLEKVLKVCEREGIDFDVFQREHFSYPEKHSEFYKNIMRMAFPMKLKYRNPKVFGQKQKNKTPIIKMHQHKSRE